MGSVVAKYAFMPPTPASYEGDERWVEWISSPSGAEIPIRMVSFHPATKWTILLSHGNAEDLGQQGPWLENVSRSCQCNVVAYDYKGYGPRRMDAVPSGPCAIKDLNAVISYLRDKKDIPADKVILFGRSLGTGPTCAVAAKMPDIAGVVLQSPLMSCIRVATGWGWTPFFDVFQYDSGSKYFKVWECRNIDEAPKMKMPCLVIHGDADRVIPVAHGIAMSEKLGNLYKFQVVKGAGHNDIEYSMMNEYWKLLRDFAEHCRGKE